VYVTGYMRFKDVKGVIPEEAREADDDGWQLCPDGTSRRTLETKGVEISVPFKKKGHGTVPAGTKSKTALLQIISPHKSIKVTWNEEWVPNPRVTRAELNAAWSSGKPTLVKKRGDLPDRYIYVEDMVDKA